MNKLSTALLLLCVLCLPANADDTVPVPKPEATVAFEAVPELSAEEAQAAEEKQKQQNAVDNLENIHSALKEKTQEQLELQRKLKAADVVTKPVIQIELDKVTADVKSLQSSFEQVAIGGISLQKIGNKEKKFDWQQEMVLITQPLIESLKSLTEKPRQTEYLRSTISSRKVQAKEIDKAIASVESRLAANPPKLIKPSLDQTLSTWETRKKDNTREIELAEFQLESLLGSNEPWYQTVLSTLKIFIGGRGTTILIAAIASVGVWLFMKGILWLAHLRKKQRVKSSKPTRYRVALYVYKLLTGLFIAIAIMIVLYVRGDILLLALMVIIFTGLAFTLREMLPRYINEARALLNMGTIREEERVIYNGVPWQVTHINMYSIFRNPELQGVLRIPLSEVINLNSRQMSRNESWFPCSKGDSLLMPDGAVAEVLSQTPEKIELKSKGGMRLSHPTSSMFTMAFYNLSRGESYGVSSAFGIDYSLQNVSLTTVPEQFQEAIHEGLKGAGLGEHVLDVLVEFKLANSSSLDYLIYVTMHSRVASSYFKIERVIQQSCVRACNDNDWGIPFPQMTIHKAG